MRRLFLLAPLLLAACGAPESDAADGAEEPATDTSAVSGTVLAPAAALRLATSIVADADPHDANDDRDRDGLSDAWETVVLERFQPLIELDEHEKGLEDSKFRTGVAARVVPRAGDPSHVVVFFAFAWSEDYGSCGLTEHHGDVERAVLELARVPGTAGDATIVKAYTASHEGDITDKSEKVTGESNLRSHLEFVRDNALGGPGYRWLVYTSRNKHGTFLSKGSCESKKLFCLADYCGADGVDDKNTLRRLPPILNAGEPTHPLESSWNLFGYAGVDVWTAKKFCGLATSGDCDAAPRESLTKDPFTKSDI